MQRIAFKMQLNNDQKAEYQKRHDQIWPELVHLLKNAGIEDYSIFLDEETYALFGVLKIADESELSLMPKQEIMQKWWAYMADIMEVNPDKSPLSKPLQEVFYMA
jgi:L-rhamnose mutarotase